MTDRELLPCPFCGAGTTEIRENGRPWLGTRYGDPSSVSVRHWCEPIEGQPSRMIERVGRDRATAVAAWNMRAALSKSGDWARTTRLADDAAESVICTVGRSPRERQWVLYPEQIAADPYLEDAIAHLEWRGIAKAVREDGRVTVIFEEKP